jgi:hypothetical protein
MAVVAPPTAVLQRGPVPALAGGSRRRVQGIFLAALAAYVFGLAWTMQNASYDVWGAVVLAPVLVAVTLPLASRVAAREGDVRLRRLIVAALLLKLMGALVRYYVAFTVYQGDADAGTYHDAGTALAPAFRALNFGVDVPGPGGGTAVLKVFTGLVYAVIGPTRVGGFLLFSWIGFWGLYFFYRAFRVGFPEGNARRYAALVFLLPSLLYWPSSIGKEALITFTLGVSAYGAARLYAQARGAVLVLALGLVGTAMVRSHIALLMFVAVSTGYLIRRSRSKSPFAPLGKAVGMAMLVATTVVMIGQFKDDLNIGTLDLATVQATVSDTESRTTLGGSQFDAGGAGSIASIPRVFATLLFRPFPFEAHNLQAAIASAEGALLFILVVSARKRLLALFRYLRSPYVLMAVVFTVLFCFAYSGFSNFGLIARQRVQLFPFVLVLLALPPRGEGARGRLRTSG